MQTKSKQPPWEVVFIAHALVAQTRTHCVKFRVGAVIAYMDSGMQQILSTGYNGPPRGVEHCDEVGCAKDAGSRCRGAHAEMNAIANAARAGIRIDGAWLFSSLSPCIECAKHIINAGIIKVVYLKQYATEGPKKEEAELALKLLESQIEIEKFTGDLDLFFSNNQIIYKNKRVGIIS